MITKTQKEQTVNELADSLKTAKSVVFSYFGKIDVKTINDFRRKMTEQKCNYRVAKKTLVSLALAKLGKELDIKVSSGTLGIATSSEDEILPFKELSEFGKKQETFKVFGGIVDGQIIAGADVQRFANLPGKQALRGQLLSVINGPASGFVNVLAGNMRGLINVLKAKAEKA